MFSLPPTSRIFEENSRCGLNIENIYADLQREQIMRIIITGATSFIGRASAAYLESRGHELIRLRHSFDEEPDRLPRTAEVWLHFAWAGSGSSDRADEVLQRFNVDMTMEAVHKADELGCKRFVFAGSQAEYGHQQDGGLKTEYGPTYPVSEYGKGKEVVRLLTERYISENDSSMQYVHMRIFSVYGPGDHAYSLVNSLIEGFKRDETIELGNCTQLWNYLYINDAAEAVGLLCEKAEAGIYNVAGDDIRTLRAYVEELYELMGGRGIAAFGRRADNAEGPADLSPDISRIKALGFTPKTSFAEGVRSMLES